MVDVCLSVKVRIHHTYLWLLWCILAISVQCNKGSHVRVSDVSVSHAILRVCELWSLRNASDATTSSCGSSSVTFSIACPCVWLGPHSLQVNGPIRRKDINLVKHTKRIRAFSPSQQWCSALDPLSGEAIIDEKIVCMHGVFNARRSQKVEQEQWNKANLLLDFTPQAPGEDQLGVVRGIQLMRGWLQLPSKVAFHPRSTASTRSHLWFHLTSFHVDGGGKLRYLVKCPCNTTWCR